MEEAPLATSERDREELLEALAGFPDELERAVAGRSMEALCRPASDGGWGVVENLCHLRDWEEIFVERARVLIGRDRPKLPAYDDELWAIERDYRGQEPHRVVQRFRALRGELLALLAGATSDDWRRVGIHAVAGDVDLAWLAERARRHGEEHLRQVREALA